MGVLLKVVVLCLLLVKMAEQHEIIIALVLTCGESILKEIFNYLQSTKKRCCIVIDEFNRLWHIRNKTRKPCSAHISIPS